MTLLCRKRVASAFTLADTDGAVVSQVLSITANSIVLGLAGTVAPSDKLSVSYVPPGFVDGSRLGPVTDVNGNSLAGFTGLSVTVS